MSLKRKVITSLMTIGLVSSLVGGATFAEFSSQQNATSNSFTAGTLSIQISKDGTNFGSDGVSGTWVSPSNWAPGQTVDGTISLTNTGSVNAQHIYFGLRNLSHSGGTGSVDLMDKIIVKSIKEKFNGVETAEQVQNIASQVGNRDTTLTLKELASSDYYTWDDQSSDNITLQAGDKKDYALSFQFQFDPNAGNEYQDAKASFDINANATQNSPTDGYVKLHQ